MVELARDTSPRSTAPGEGQADEARMPFTAHLEELRSRLIRSLLAALVASLLCYSVVERLFLFLTAPLVGLQAPGLSLIGTGVPDAFFIKIKIALIGGFCLSFPIILWQAWQFVAPGLYAHEKKHARGFVFFGTLLFLLGAGFCYTVVFPAGFEFLIQRYQVLEVRPAIRIDEYLSFSARLLVAFGVAFQLPVVAYFLTRVGLIDHTLLLRQFRYGVVLIFILAAILTPPDWVSQILLAVPLALLYGVSIGVAYLAKPK